jgi:aminoglycoside 6-adenylyltransferase
LSPISHNELDKTLRQLIDWGQEHGEIRAMILNSTRAMPTVPLDAFSDYDVILAVPDIYPFFEDRSWLEDFGRVLMVYRDPITLEHGHEQFAYITQYEDGTKIDFILWSVELLRQVALDAELPDVLDVGYRVLFDKDGLTGELKSPSYKAHIPNPPTEQEFLNAIEEFYHGATYVAKHLRRDDLLPAKYNLDYMMKHKWLRRMLEWRIEIDHDWSLRPGAYGKRLKIYLSPANWAELESTYCGASIDENRRALFKTLDLFRRVGREVGAHLGYTYPEALDHRVSAYLQRVKKLEKGS